MTVDYRPRPPSPKAKRRGGGSCGFWFVFGAVLGGFGVGLFVMLRTPIQAPPEAVAAAAAAKGEKAEAPKSAVPTRFSFHDILPELEVVVSDNELSKPDPKKPEEKKPEDKKAEVAKKPEDKKAEPTKTEPAKPVAEAAAGSYMLQVASLRTAADAERLKAQLAMQGIQVKVQTVTVNGKDTYHRLQAGPFQGKQAVNDARSQLKTKGMDPIPIKLK
jgi:cell division septation protein DedD